MSRKYKFHNPEGVMKIYRKAEKNGFWNNLRHPKDFAFGGVTINQ